MRHSIRNMRNVSTTSQRRYQTLDGSAIIEQMAPRTWRVHRRGGEPFFVTTQAQAVGMAFAIPRKR